MDRERAFGGWVMRANAGDLFRYHTGFLAYDRAHVPWQEKEAFRGFMRALRTAEDAGLVTFVQRRVGPGICDYFAVKLEGKRHGSD